MLLRHLLNYFSLNHEPYPHKFLKIPLPLHLGQYLHFNVKQLRVKEQGPLHLGLTYFEKQDSNVIINF